MHPSNWLGKIHSFNFLESSEKLWYMIQIKTISPLSKLKMQKHIKKGSGFSEKNLRSYQSRRVDP
uniref:Uncharacterized protein n=1 Tax=Arundo donax TaxID=35708 RepID=A0A0A8ZEJ0_ARUDO